MSISEIRPDHVGDHSIAQRARDRVRARRDRLAERIASTIVVIEHEVPADRLEDSWELYITSFEHLRTTAVQRHLMTRDEFNAVMLDPRVEKHTVIDMDRGAIAALMIVTTDLYAMPLISPDYFEARWPGEYERGHIWYLGFVAINNDYHGTGVFARIVGSVVERVAEAQGVCALDLCRRNEEVFSLPTAITRCVETFYGEVSTYRLDEQTYWAWGPKQADPATR
jgi:hypothetical protein